MSEVQIAIIDQEDTQITLAVPGVQGPSGAISSGGSANQVFYKVSGTNYDAGWTFIGNANVDAAAAIAGTKISPNFGAQNILTTGTNTAASFIPTSNSIPSNGIYLPAANQVAISTNGTGRVFVNASGYVGISKSSPESGIDIRPGATGDLNAITMGYGRSANPTDAIHKISWASDDLVIAADTANTIASNIIFNNDGSEKMRIDSSGRLLVGTSTSQGSYNLQCFGTGVWGQGAYVNGSDASIKQNVSNLPPSLDVVKNLRPVTFEYKPEYSQDQTIQAGFIAQELREAMQGQDYLDGIVQQGTNHLNVAYQSIIPVLTKALQEAIGRIETLEAEVAALKGAQSYSLITPTP